MAATLKHYLALNVKNLWQAPSPNKRPPPFFLIKRQSSKNIRKSSPYIHRFDLDSPVSQIGDTAPQKK